MDIATKAERLQDEYELCDHCLGRQFARLGYGLENYERGLIIRAADTDAEELGEDSFVRENIPDEGPRTSPCDVCDGLFENLDHFGDRVLNALERYEFGTFLVGCRPPADVVEAEEQLWEQVGIQWVEPIKSELNRLIGKRLEEQTDATVDFERPDVNPVLDIGKDRVEMQVNSLFLYGQYNKYSRDLPQTKWPCGNCRGKGCEECDWTGKQYQESVEELIADPLLEAARAVESKFHGAGREDVDAQCLGRREFVIEILEPEDRDIDPAALQDEINDRHGDTVEVFELQFTDRHTVEAVKSRRADKTYRATVELADPVDADDLAVLNELVGTVEQRTPSRVSHRRADKVRKRQVMDVDWELVDDTTLELTVTTEAGTYVKELVSGDEDRTEPSVAGLLGVAATVAELDVIEIEKPEDAPG